MNGATSGLEFLKGYRDLRTGNGIVGLYRTIRAEARFPLAMPLREAGVTSLTFTNAMHPDYTMLAIRRALKTDPNNPVILYHAIVQELRRLNIDGAKEHFEVLKKIGPRWPEIENTRVLIQEVEKRIGKQ